MKKIIVIDVEKCLACRSCEIACAVEHSKSKKLLEAIKEEPLSQPRVNVEGLGDLAVPLQCRHCEDAPCAKVCPTKATVKLGDEEPVIIKEELCIGCRLCILTCPFGIIKMRSDGKVVIKCDLCLERLKKGEEPACVQACPTHAIQFKSVNEVTEGKRKKLTAEFLVRIKNSD